MVKELVFRFLYDKKSWIYRMALIILCRLHDFTKYKTARTINDLFYWPEGLCLDMVVIIAFFVIAAMCIYNDFTLLTYGRNENN